MFPVKTLETLIEENEDVNKTITYLKMDVEGFELLCFKSWLHSGVLSFVQQIGIEIHTGNVIGNEKFEKKLLKGAIEFTRKLAAKQKLFLVHYNPNLYTAKRRDRSRKYYTHHDLLFVKDA